MEQLYLFDDEEWRDVKGYEGLYQVSNWGRVKSFCKQKVLNLFCRDNKQNGGYLAVNLYKNGTIKMHSIHRLVASAFIPNSKGFSQVNHKDENKQNNDVNNLEWCDVKYNINYGTRTKRMAENLSVAIEQVAFDGTIVKKWNSLHEAGRNGFSIGHICQCCKGKRHYHKGYIWRYAE